MHHPHEPIMCSRKKINKTEEITHQCYFKAGDAEKKNNTPTSFTHIVMQTMQWISHTDGQSSPHYLSSMILSSTGAPKNSQKLSE